MNQRHTCKRCGTEFLSASSRLFKQPCDYCRNADFSAAVVGLKGNDPKFAHKMSLARQKYLNLSN